jgi:hypothetical protein
MPTFKLPATVTVIIAATYAALVTLSTQASLPTQAHLAIVFALSVLGFLIHPSEAVPSISLSARADAATGPPYDVEAMTSILPPAERGLS